MVDAGDQFSIGGLWQFCWSGRVSAAAVTWPIADMVLPGMTVRSGAEARVESLDTAARTATLSNGDVLQYDACVLSPGCVSDASDVPGLEEHCLDVCSFTQATQAKASLDAFVARAKRRLAAEAKGEGENAGAGAGGRKLTFVYAIARMPYKCPPLPMEVTMLLDEYLREAGVRHLCRIVLASPVPWPVGGAKGKAVFLPILEEKGIEYLASHVLASVETGASAAAAAADTEETTEPACVLQFQSVGAGGAEDEDKDAAPVQLEADLLWGSMPQRAPAFLSGLSDKSGFVPVDLQTNRCTANDGACSSSVFAIGDACKAVMPGPKKMHPKAGEFAFQMGSAVADILAAGIDGADTDPLPTGRMGACFAETGGGGAGVLVQPDLSAVINAPSSGMPKMSFTVAEGPVGTEQKMKWANSYIARIFGDDARMFSLE